MAVIANITKFPILRSGGAQRIWKEELIARCRNLVEAIFFAKMKIDGTASSYTSAEFKAFKESLRLNIGFFHLNFTLLSQNQRPNKPPIQSLIGLDALTFRVVSTGSLTPSS